MSVQKFTAQTSREALAKARQAFGERTLILSSRPIAGGVVTYELKGRQYVAVASGHSGGSIPLTGSTTIVIFGQ